MTRTIAFLIQLALLLQVAPLESNTGVVTGLLITKDGAPAAGVRVRALGRTMISTVTDSAGRYRLESIPPGEHHIVAEFMGVSTYFPGVSAFSDAKAIPVVAGREVANIDFTMVPAPTVRISGRVILSGKEAVVGAVSVTLLPDSAQGLNSILETTLAPDGTFAFSQVPSGRYQLVPNRAQLPITEAMVPIAVPSEGLADVIVSKPVTTPITIRLEVEGRGDVPAVVVNLARLGNSGGGKNITVRGTTVTDLPIGEYRAYNERLPAGYSVKSIATRATDLMRTPLTVVEGAEVEIVYTLSFTPQR